MSLMILCFVCTSEDEEKIYSDTAHESINEPCRGGSIVRHETVDRERLS
jgi:hypothetical protein